PDPHAPGRMYRTGDRARWLPDGELEFLGRLDDQVKLHGQRVEPGEIAAVLRAHPEVADCAVLARQDDGGPPRLVAWVVPRHGTTAAADALRAFLRERLAEHMVPS